MHESFEIGMGEKEVSVSVKPMPYDVSVVPGALDVDNNELRAYVNIARQINFLPQELSEVLRYQILSMFKERNIRLFDYKETHAYLVTEAWKIWKDSWGDAGARRYGLKSIPVWCWRPLRNEDRSSGWHVSAKGEDWRVIVCPGRQIVIKGESGTYTIGEERIEHYQVMRHGFYDPANSACRPYDKLIPMRVIDRVREIEEQQEQFVGKVRFFVSDFDYYFRYPADPFIAIKLGYRKSQDDLLIFDVWDEPSFTG